MKNNLRKRSLCVLLAVLMVFGTFTAGALAADAETGLPFIDVAPGAWYFVAVEYVYENGIMTGTSPTTFSPRGALTRAQFVTILWRVAGEPEVEFRPVFDDVPADQWFSNAVIWAYDEELVTGTSPTTFAPSANITREQLVTMLYRYAEFLEQDISDPAEVDLDRFTDQDSISDWAMPAMRWAVFTGLIGGTSPTTLTPRGNATRAQAANILVNFLWRETEPPIIEERVDLRDLLGMTLDELMEEHGDLLGEYTRCEITGRISFPDVELIIMFEEENDDLEIANASVHFLGNQSDLFHIGGINYSSTRDDFLAEFGKPLYIRRSWEGNPIYVYANMRFMLRPDPGPTPIIMQDTRPIIGFGVHNEVPDW